MLGPLGRAFLIPRPTFLTYVLPVTTDEDRRNVKGEPAGIRNKRKESLERLSSKTLDAKFLHEIQYGLNCSPFEAEAVLQVVKEVCFPFFSPEASQAPPGRMTLIAVDADEPAGKSISECEKRNVRVTVHRGTEADRILQRESPAAFRRARIPDMCQEAMSQGALLTREDLAYRIFFVSPRTISRDLNLLRTDTDLRIHISIRPNADQQAKGVCAPLLGDFSFPPSWPS